MKLSSDILLELLSQAFIDSKGKNVISSCPFCGKPDHFGVLLDENNRFHCFKCGEKGGVFKLLKFLDRLDLLGGRSIDYRKPLERRSFLSKKDEEIDLSVEKCIPPLSFRRIYSNEYLESRGWEKIDFEYFKVGITPLFNKLKDYVTFLVEEEEELKGYLSRCVYGKDYLKKNRLLRYRNSPDTDFSKLLYNYNNVTEETHTVIIVEGVTGCQHIVKLLNLYFQSKVVVVASFGKKMSIEQILKLKLKGVVKVILFYDNDAIQESKEFSLKLRKYFEVEVGFFSPFKDSGEITLVELEKIFESLEDPINFILSKLVRRKL